MSDFKADCGGQDPKKRAKLKASVLEHVREIISHTGPCERCLSIALGVWREAIEDLIAEHSPAVQEAVRRRVDTIESEGNRIAEELLRGAR